MWRSWHYRTALICAAWIGWIEVTWAQTSSPSAPPETSASVLSVYVHIAGEGMTLLPATEPQLQVLQTIPEHDRHVVAVLLQDIEGQVTQHQFVFQSQDLDKLRQGGMLIVSFPQKKYADILSLQLGIVTGFERFYLNPVGVSLQDAIAQPAEQAVFGFGLLRE